MLFQFLSWCPGAFGLLLRQIIYPIFLKKCGKGVLFGRFVQLKGANKISIGRGVVVNDRAVLDATQFPIDDTAITVEDSVFLGAGTVVECRDHSVAIQKNSNIGSECRIIADTKLVIGKNVLLAAYCHIGWIEDKNNLGDSTTMIGDGCWFGVRTILYSGNKVGEGTVVGAHSEIKTSLPEKVVAFGNPAIKVYSRQ